MIVSFSHEQLYREYRSVVLSYISARVPSPDDAEDICEEVFIKLFRMLETYDENRASVSTLIYRIAHNAVIDHLRTAHPREDLSEEQAVFPSAEDIVMDIERSAELADAIEMLPQQQRDILILRFYRGWTLKKIAEKMGLTYKTAADRQKKALDSLRKMLKE